MSEKLTIGKVQSLMREFSRRGEPEKGAKLNALFAAGEEIPSELFDPERKIKSEKASDGKLVMPPRTGRGSGQEKWAEFAQEVSDFDAAVLEMLDRDAIIEALEQRGIIEEVVPEEDEDDTTEEE